MASGRRGRRWREAVSDDRGLRHALLLETAPDGRFTHLELATPAGLLTLHPEADGTLHGNAIGTDGLRHVAGLAFDADAAVVVAGSPIAQAAIAVLLRHAVAPGASVERAVLEVTADLRVSVERWRIERLDRETWRIAGDAPFGVDADGLPRLAAAETWPLELPAE